MRSICVFCGSRNGHNPEFETVAKQLANALVENNFTLIYGAGDIGLMGILADQVLKNSGQVIGIIPKHLCNQEIVHDALTELYITDNMLERKQLMLSKADAFIALPGGLGTLDEILEVITWRQLGQLDKPLCLVNTNDFYAPFISLLQSLVNSGFVDQSQLDCLPLSDSPGQAIDYLRSSLG